MDEAAPVVARDSHLTLHYALRLTPQGDEVISTFGGRPATLQLGAGQLAESLESLLVGMHEGSQRRFTLDGSAAFGERSPGLIQALSRSAFDANTDAATDGDYAAGDLVRIRGDGGEQVAGVIKSIDAERVVVDFNHPLAGRPVEFEVQILGIL